MSTAYQNILLEKQGGITTITLNRPDKLNTFTEDMHIELRQALDTLQDDLQVRVLVLTGAGRGFCAGQDLSDKSVLPVNGKKVDFGALVEKFYQPLVLRLQNLKVPTIAAVNGVAAGAGSSLALACDLVVASQSASFIQSFSKVGLIPDTGGSYFLPKRVGMSRAMGLALLAEKLPAEKAEKWGLIWQCVADEEFADTIKNLAEQLAKAPTKALVRTRQLMHASSSHTLEQQLSMEGAFMRELGFSDDFAEGSSAFANRRAPVFTGL